MRVRVAPAEVGFVGKYCVRGASVSDIAFVKVGLRSCADVCIGSLSTFSFFSHRLLLSLIYHAGAYTVQHVAGRARRTPAMTAYFNGPGGTGSDQVSVGEFLHTHFNFDAFLNVFSPLLISQQ